jgi:hypothetical protein
VSFISISHAFSNLNIIIVIFGKKTLLDPQPSSEDSVRFVDRPVFTSLNFVTIFLQINLVSLASLRTRSLYLCSPMTGWPSYIPGHRVPFWSLLRLAGLRWRYSNPPPQRDHVYYIYIFFSLALQPSWALAYSFSFMITLQTVVPLGRVISSSQGLYLNTGQRKQNKYTHTPNIHALSGIRTYDPSVRASEDSSCIRPLGYCDRHIYYI